MAFELKNFLDQFEKLTNSKIESLAKEHNFVLHESAFPSSEQFTFNYVDCEQVADIINAMPKIKAAGIDKVLNRVLKDSLPIILPFITSVVNASLLSSTFPEV